MNEQVPEGVMRRVQLGLAQRGVTAETQERNMRRHRGIVNEMCKRKCRGREGEG